MTAIRLALPAFNFARVRPLDRRWSLLFGVVAALGLFGGVQLVEQVAVMAAQVLFIAFTLTFLITFLLMGIGMVRRATRSPQRTGSPRRSGGKTAGYLAYSLNGKGPGHPHRYRRHARA